MQKTITAIMSGLPEIYADEFDFLLTTLKSAQKEHAIWVLQAITLATRPLQAHEATHVEGSCPGCSGENPGESTAGDLIDFVRPFYDLGYVVIVGNNLTLSDKGRAFADYVTAKGYKVHALNDMKFVADYVPFSRRFGRTEVAPE